MKICAAVDFQASFRESWYIAWASPVALCFQTMPFPESVWMHRLWTENKNCCWLQKRCCLWSTMGCSVCWERGQFLGQWGTAEGTVLVVSQTHDGECWVHCCIHLDGLVEIGDSVWLCGTGCRLLFTWRGHNQHCIARLLGCLGKAVNGII